MTAFRPVVARTTVARLGVRLQPRGAGPDPRVLLGLALRDNPRRAQLLVSRVLGKHVPTDPRVVHAAGLLLGGLVADTLVGRPQRPLPVDLLHEAVRATPGAAAALHGAARHGVAAEPVDAAVLGFAETATALGHCVAEALGGADYLHSTRRPVAGVATAGAFVEEHSHHTGHLVLPSDPGLLAVPRPLILVDDELSTGRTAVNTIVALHRTTPRARYVLATLVDLREDALVGLPDGVRVDVVALGRAELTLPVDLAERAAALRAELAAAPTHLARAAPPPHRRVLLTDLGWPAGLPAGGRHGFTGDHHRLLTAALPQLGLRLARAADVRPGERTLVLGTEELMAVPLRLAVALVEAGNDVRFSTTTRSPALVVDEPDYAITSGITFPDHDDPADGPGTRFAYNIGGHRQHDDPADGPGPRFAYNIGGHRRHDDPVNGPCHRFAYNIARSWDHVLVAVDPPADTAALRTGLLVALAPYAGRITVVVTP